MTDFQNKVVAWVRQIPRGKVASYAAVAAAAGSPGAARAVGSIMKANRDKTVPCHRVICSDGRLGGYNGNFGTKIDLLLAEGIVVDTKTNRVIGFELEFMRNFQR